MKRLLLSVLVFVASSFGAVQCAEAQLPWQLPRPTAIGDSSMFVCSDTLKTHTYGCTRAQFLSGIHVAVADSARVAGSATTATVASSATLADTVKLGGRDSVTLGSTKLRAGKRFILVGSDTLFGQLNVHDTVSCVSGCVIVGQPAYGTLQQHLKADSASLADSTNVVRTTVDSLVTGATQPAKDSSAKIATTRYVDKAVAAGGASFPLLAPDGTAAVPSYKFSNATDTVGMYRVGTDTLGFSTKGVRGFTMSGGATSTLIGGAGNMTLLAGTGNSRTITLQATNSSGVAQNVLSASSSQTTLFVNSGANLLGSSNTRTTLYANGSPFFLGDVNGDSLVFVGPNSGVRMLTLGGTVGGDANALLTGGAGNMTIQAGTGASRTMTLQTTTSGSAAKNTLVLGADSSVTAIGQFRAPDFNGSGGFVFSGATNTGMSRDGNGFLNLVQGGNAIVTLRGAVSVNFAAPLNAPNGTAALPSYTFAAGADTTIGLYKKGTQGANDTLGIAVNGVSQVKIGAAGVLLFPNLPSEGSTKNAVCWDGTTFNVTQNAAATCTVSAARFKTDIAPITFAEADRIVPRLVGTHYREKEDGRRAFGIIADSAAVVDRRLASFDSKGLVTSTNYEQVTTLLLTKVQEQQATIDALQHQIDELEVRTIRLEQPCGISGHAPWCEQPSAPDTRLVGYKPAPDQQATIDALRALVCSEKANRRKKVCLH